MKRVSSRSMKNSHGELDISIIIRTFDLMGLNLALGKHCLQDSVSGVFGQNLVSSFLLECLHQSV